MKENLAKKILDNEILITGASGFIGTSLFKLLERYLPLGLQNKPRLTNNFIACDLTDENATKKLFAQVNPKIIFHFAAMASPGRNEQEPELAYASHIKITENIINNISADTHMVFLSTDKVFDGSNPCPLEGSPTNPQCIYGRLKLQCEQMISRALKKHHIIRIPIAHALGDLASPSFVDKAVAKIKAGQAAEVFSNVYRCFVTLEDLLKVLEASISDTHYGIYHIGSRLMSYSERIKQICLQEGIPYQDKLVFKDGQVFPLSQNLNTDKLKRIFGTVAN